MHSMLNLTESVISRPQNPKSQKTVHMVMAATGDWSESTEEQKTELQWLIRSAMSQQR